MPPDHCPNCGEEIPPRSKACPECGACEQTGWSEDAHSQSLGIPDNSFDYDEFVKKEFGSETSTPPSRARWWGLVAIFLIAALLFLAVF